MNKDTEKKLEKVKQFMELADSYGIVPIIELSVYGNHSKEFIKKTNKLFRNKLRAEDDHAGIGSSWRRWHNAKRGFEYTSSSLKIVTFYPKGNING